MRQTLKSQIKFRRCPHHSFGQVVVDKVLPGDLSASVPEEEISDGRQERRSAQQEHPELFIVPGNVALKQTQRDVTPEQLNTWTGHIL